MLNIKNPLLHSLALGSGQRTWLTSSLLAFAVFLLFSSGGLQAQTYWTGAVDNDWQTAGNWDSDLPAAGVAAHIANGDTVFLSSGTGMAGILLIYGESELQLSSGASLVAERLSLDFSTNGTFIASGAGTTALFDSPNVVDIVIGSASGFGLMIVEDGAVVQTGIGDSLVETAFRNNASGLLRLSGTPGSRGVLATDGIRVVDTSASAAIEFDGGVLRALKNQGNFLQDFQSGDVTIHGGGAFIDTNGFNVGISTDLGGTGGLTKQGAGALTLTGVNTYTGGTTISDGTLRLSSNQNLGASAGTLTLNGGTLQNTAAFTTNRVVNLGAGGGTFQTDANLTLGGQVTGAGTLTKTGTGILTLSATINNHTGDMVVSQGTLQVNTLAIGNIGGNIANNSEVIFFVAPNFGSNYFNVMSGTGVLTKTGSGTVGLFGNNTFTGGLNINGGVVVVGNNANLGDPTGALSFDGGTLRNNGSFSMNRAITLNAGGGTFSTSSDLTQAGVISGIGSLTKEGSQVLTLTGANTYTGGTNIDNGTLQIGDGGTTGSIVGNITNNAALTFNRSNDLTLGGIISGSGSVAQEGSGTLTLSGANTYSGISTVSGGTLQVGDGGSTGSLGSGNVVNNAILAFNRSNTYAVANEISGTGSVNQMGSGVLTLSGANTYTGGTTIDDGTLLVTNTTGSATGTGTVNVNSGATLGGTGTIGGPVTVANGGILSPGNSPGTLTMGSLTLDSGSILNYELGDPGPSDFIQVNGNLTLDGIMNITALSGFGSGTYGLFGYTGSLTDNGLLFGSVPGLYDLTVDTNTSNEVNLHVAVATAQYWDGANTTANGVVNGGTGTWDGSATNWTNTGGNANAAWAGTLAAIFGGTAGTVTIADGFTANATGYGFEVGGYTLAADGTGEIALTGTTHFVTNGGTTTITAPINGTGALEKQGGGALVLSGTNTYTGGTSITGGVLRISADENLGAASGGLFINGARLRTTESFATSRDTILGAGGAQISTRGTTTLSHNGLISGSGVLTKLGPGTLELNADNTYTGGTVISDGTLQLGNGGTTGSILGDVLNDAALVFNRSNDLTFNGEISGTGTVSQIGTGVLTLANGANSYTGGTILHGGTLRIGATGATGDGIITVLGSTISYADGVVEQNPIDLQNDLFLEVLGADSARQNGVIGETGGSYGITKIGEGTLRLTGANTFTGRTEVNEGALVLRNGGSIDSDEAVVIGTSIFDDGTLRVNGAGAGASLATQDRLVVGRSGMGRLVVSNGGVVTADVVRLGGQEDGDGFVRVTGTGSELTSQSILNVGAQGIGFLEIEDGGIVNTVDMFVGRRVDALGGVLIDGTDSRLNATGEVVIGNRGIGEMYILGGGGLSQDGDAGVGIFADALGGVAVAEANSFWEIGGDLTLGDQGFGVLEVSEGGRVTAGGLVLGSDFDGAGQLLLDGGASSLTLNGTSVIGDQWIGGLLVLDGAALVQGGSSFVGLGSDGEGEVEVRGSGSQWTVGNSLNLGEGGFGRLRILGGGQVTTEFTELGVQADSLGVLIVRGDGSVLTNTVGDINVGISGEGRLTVRDGGRVQQDSPIDGPIILASMTGSSGILSIGSRGATPAAPGIIDVASVAGGAGDAILNFNHTSGNYFFTRDGTSGGAPVLIGGSTVVNHSAGHTTLTAPNTHTGGTTLTGGTLVAAHGQALGTGPLSIQGGEFVVPQPLQVGDNMNWDGGTIFQTIGDATTSIDVNGALALTAPGAFDFTSGVGFRNKTDYLLISTTGALPYDVAADFTGNSLFGLDPEFIISGGNLLVRYPDSLIISGATLQNSNPVGTPFFADFVVIGPVQTGGPAENNIVDSLTFRPGSSLQVFNTLQVTTGRLDVPTGGASLDGGTIFVPGNLVRTGGGTLVIGSNVNVNGPVNLNGGMTRLNGIVTTPGGLTVNPGAGLGGTGRIVGNVFNNGLVSPGNSIGTLVVDGNYTQSSGGTFLAEVTSGGRSDTLFVTGQARLAGTLRVSALGPVSFGDTTTIVVAQGGIIGRFDRVVGAPSGFRARQWTSGPRPNQLNLVFAPASYTQVAQGSNQLELARALDQWIGIEGGEIGAATLSLDFLRAEQYPLVFGAILPTLYSNLSAVQFQQSYADGRTVIRQAQTAQTAPRATRGEEDDRPHWRVWADARGMFSEQSPLDMDSKGGTLLAGADLLIREHLIGGFYAGGSHIETDDRRPGYRGSSARMGLYGAWNFLKQAYLSAVIGGGKSTVDTRRIGAFGINADADVDSTDWFGRLETGYRLEAGGFQVTPLAGLQWSENRFDTIRENADSVFALEVDSWKSRRLDGYLGVEASYPIVVREHYRVSPYGRLTLRDSLHQDDPVLRARLNRGEGPAFTYRGEGVDADGIELGAGLQIWDTRSSWMLHLGFTTLQGDDSTYQQINLGLSVGL